MFDIPDDYKPQTYLTSQQVQETTQYLLNHPLFMHQLPEDPSKNEHLVALQHIIYDQDSLSLAQHFNAKGNQLIKQHPGVHYYMKSALKNYTEGIQAKCEDPELNSKLYSNRAHVQMSFGNFGSGMEDCRQAIKLNPKFMRPYYRMAICLKALDRLEQAEEWLRKALELEPNNKQLRSQLNKVSQSLKGQSEKKQAKESKAEESQRAALEYCREREYKVKKLGRADLPAHISLTQEGIFFPVLFLYPEYESSDFISQAHQTSFLEDHLSTVLELGIPQNSAFRPCNVHAYLLFPKTILRLHPRITIGQIARKSQWVQGCVQISVVRKKGEEWLSRGREIRADDGVV